MHRICALHVNRADDISLKPSEALFAKRFDKALKQLRDMQEQRRRQELWVMPEAARLLKMHKAKGVAYNPVDDGFVVSERDIQTYIQRQDRKNQAYAVASNHP